MKYPNWQILEKRPITDKKNLLKTVLKNRGIEDMNDFLFPVHPDTFSLSQLGISPTNLSKAITRISKEKNLPAGKAGKIIIYGDYDADGVCATAILWEALFKKGLDVLPFVPNRFEEGYGINTQSIKKLIKKYPNLKLIITVDNGITAHEAIEFANKNGIDVIITDHHASPSQKPSAYATIHTTKISGSAVSWVLAKSFNKEISKKTLDLVAIGTIADQLKLLSLNRSFVSHGLSNLRNTTRLGLKEILKLSKVLPENIDTYVVNFIIAPRINSTGRLGDAMESLRLLCTTNQKRANTISNSIEKINQKRQKIVAEIVETALKKASKKNWDGLIMISDKSFHEGVIGLAASRLVETFNRPSIVVSKGEKISKASARSIPGFNIISVIKQLDSFLISGGGHEGAAGFSIETSRLEEFFQNLNNLSKPLLTKEILEKKLTIDAEIDFSLLNWDILSDINRLSPFGNGNSRPIFISKKVQIKNIKPVGTDNKHLKFKFFQKGREYSAIAFGFGEYLQNFSEGDNVDIAYYPTDNTFNGTSNIELHIKDIKKPPDDS